MVNRETDVSDLIEIPLSHRSQTVRDKLSQSQYRKLLLQEVAYCGAVGCSHVKIQGFMCHFTFQTHFNNL
jgi:hypothetical protein